MKKSFKVVTGLLALLGVATVAACSSSDTSGDPAGDTPDPNREAGSPDTDGSTPTNHPDGGGPSPTDSGGGDSSAPVDAGSDARPDPSCTGLAYCENFESYALATPIANNTTVGPWTATIGGAAVMTIDSVRPYGGAKALHIKVPNADTGASGLLNLTKAAGLVTGNNLFGRVMVYYSKSTSEDKPNGVHSWVFQGTGTSTASGKIMTLNLANNGTSYFLNYHGDSNSPAEASKNGGTPVAAKWVCVQWEYNSSGTPAADDAKVSIDGTQVLEATKATQMWNLATPFTKMQFGFTHYQVLTNAIDVYLDDFAVDTKAVPCPP